MSDAIEQAKASFERWNTAFNARDMDGTVAEMHFPHRRLSGDNEFQVWRTEDDYRATRGESLMAHLNAQAWDHTATPWDVIFERKLVSSLIRCTPAVDSGFRRKDELDRGESDH